MSWNNWRDLRKVYKDYCLRHQCYLQIQILLNVIISVSFSYDFACDIRSLVPWEGRLTSIERCVILRILKSVCNRHSPCVYNVSRMGHFLSHENLPSCIKTPCSEEKQEIIVALSRKGSCFKFLVACCTCFSLFSIYHELSTLFVVSKHCFGLI